LNWKFVNLSSGKTNQAFWDPKTYKLQCLSMNHYLINYNFESRIDYS
jgi:hypothetical protein